MLTTNRIPIAVSSERSVLRVMRPMAAAFSRQKPTAIRYTRQSRGPADAGTSHSPRATPPNAAWPMPWPMKAIFLRTT